MLLTTYYGLTIPQIIGISIAVIAVAFVFVLIRDKINRKKADTGEDKQKVWDILQRTVPEVENYTKAYADWEWETYQGRQTTTTYWYYAIAFNGERLYIVPLSNKTGELTYSDCYCIEKSSLGIVNTKQGANWVELYDKSQKEILSLKVMGENLKDDKYHPVNIIQPEAETAFIAWKDGWMKEVNDANNVTATGKMKKPLKKK